MTQVVIAVLLFTGIIWMAGVYVNLDLGTAALAMLLAALLGLGIGTLNCVLFGLLPDLEEHLVGGDPPAALRLGGAAHLRGGAAAFQAILWWNPLVHIVGVMRDGLLRHLRFELRLLPLRARDRARHLRDRRLPAAPARQLPDRAMSPAPLVSVITPVWNAAATLAATVASVRAQSLPDWEMLIVDDGSTDGSPALAAALAAGEPRLRLLGWAENRGAAAARNAGIRAARGRYLAFLDADDLWRPEKLAVQIGYMAATGAPFTFAAIDRIDPAGRRLGTVAVPARVDHARLLRGNVIPCQTAAFDRQHYGAGRDAAAAAAPGLRALADAARARRRGARAASRCSPTGGAAGLALGEQAGGGGGDLAGLPRGGGARRAAAPAWYLGHNLARGALKRLG